MNDLHPRLLNAVILAEDYEATRDWWMDAVGLELQQEWTDTYHYAELACDGNLIVGIADAKEMGTAPPTPRANAVVVQLRVDDVGAFLERIRAKGGEVLFGPSSNDDEKYSYGACTDCEGNQVWVISPLP